MTRNEAIQEVAGHFDPSWLVVACNGMISRELFASADSAGNFYMIGSMGLASSIGLGLALARPNRTVVVLDGDGNLLMNLGILGSIAAAQTQNLYHILFDNHAHGSTGNQRTISDRVSLDRLARTAGYRWAGRVEKASPLRDPLRELFRRAGPAFLLIEVEPLNTAGIKRVSIAPHRLTARFRSASLGDERE